MEVGLTPEEIKEVKDRIARETREREQKERRDAALKGFLEGDNAEVHKELYENGGLKQMIESEPEILDSPAALKLALKESQRTWQSKFKKPEEEEKPKTTTPAPETPAPASTEQRQPEQKTFDPNSQDMFDEEFQKQANLEEGEKMLLAINSPKAQSMRAKYTRK